MPLPDPKTNFRIQRVTAFHRGLGTPTGARVCVAAPTRGKIIEAGFTPNSLVASAITMAVAVNDLVSTDTASNFTQVISSTLGTFSSTLLYEGATVSAVPPSPPVVNAGDVIQFTTSGGNTSVISGTCYVDILRG
jgi:hypothetical protein